MKKSLLDTLKILTKMPMQSPRQKSKMAAIRFIKHLLSHLYCWPETPPKVAGLQKIVIGVITLKTRGPAFCFRLEVRWSPKFQAVLTQLYRILLPCLKEGNLLILVGHIANVQC